DSFKVEINAAYTDYLRTGTSGVALNMQGGILPASYFDNTRPLTPNWGFNHAEAGRVGGSLQWDIDNQTTLRAAALYRHEFRTAYSPYSLTLRTDGMYSFSALAINGPTSDQTGGYLYADRKFNTFGIQHKLTFGTNFSRNEYATPSDYAVGTPAVIFPTLAAAQNSGPLVKPSVGTTPKHPSSDFTNTNIVIGDDITLNRYFSLLAGVNYSTIRSHSYAYATGVVTASYDESALTPTASLIFKPTSNISFYGTYIESLESGGTVSLTAISPYTNAGEILPPTISNQIEFGAKADVNGVLFTLAAFQIDKANIYDVNNLDGTRTRNQDGRQVHKGIELTATGKVTDDLTIRGGGTYLDPEITKATNTATVGKAPPGVSNWRLALWGEYRLPLLQTLYLTGGVSYLSSSYLDAANTRRVPAYAIGDVGMRYETSVYGTPMIMRMNVQNVTDNHYWQNVGFGGDLVLGLPRTYSFSATVKF
ncbi:MAG: TonB-dependent receptor, partial [Hyphomicrobiaceae bacterium]